MKPVIIIAIVFVLLIPIPVFAQNVYIYVEELPATADYASNVMYLTTQAWEEANEDLQFLSVKSSVGADFRVNWVRDFGGEKVGYAIGSEFIEVGLGDNKCGEQWNPYSSKYISQIMMHEMGHIFGFEHSDDRDSLMYPIALNLEYGIVENDYRLTEGYGQFVGFCTIKDLTSYEFGISTTDEIIGFDYYVVPSYDEFVKWTENKAFQHYSNEDCFGENWLSISGTCEGISKGAGIMILMNEEITSSLEIITVKQLENPNIANSKSLLTTKLFTSERVYDEPVLDSLTQIAMENKIRDLGKKVQTLELSIKTLERINKQLTENSESSKNRIEGLQKQIQEQKETQKIDRKEIALFVDREKDPQSYIDRYNNEPSYKKWFDDNYPEYDSIEQAVGLELTQKIPSWVKNIFGLYTQDQISEEELLNAIQYLIDEGILVVE